jgi:hypothetical protein
MGSPRWSTPTTGCAGSGTRETSSSGVRTRIRNGVSHQNCPSSKELGRRSLRDLMTLTRPCGPVLADDCRDRAKSLGVRRAGCAVTGACTEETSGFPHGREKIQLGVDPFGRIRGRLYEVLHRHVQDVSDSGQDGASSGLTGTVPASNRPQSSRAKSCPARPAPSTIPRQPGQVHAPDEGPKPLLLNVGPAPTDRSSLQYPLPPGVSSTASLPASAREDIGVVVVVRSLLLLLL